jgi:abortive infection bacteriophage resistance protein
MKIENWIWICNSVFCLICGILYLTELPVPLAAFRGPGVGLIRLLTILKGIMNLKKPLTISKQLSKLKEHGLVVASNQKAKELLSRISYYRLSGYGLQFRISASSSKYRMGTTLTQITDAYLFDESLRSIFRIYLERIEIYARTSIANGFSLTKCPEEPCDAHYHSANFYNKSGYAFIMAGLAREERHSQDSLFVQHHKNRYENKMPLWVIAELLSFSNLSKLYSAMYISEQHSIATMMHTKPVILRNHLHCMSTLRNKCAHGVRLYNNNFAFPAKLGKKYLQKNPEVKADSLFAYVIVMLRRLPTVEYKKALVDEIDVLLSKYVDRIDLCFAGFPVNYLSLLRNETQ